MKKCTIWFFVSATMIIYPIFAIASEIGFSALASFLLSFCAWLGVQFAIGICEYQWSDSPCLTDEELAAAERQAQFSSDRLYIKLTQECRRIRK